MDFRTFKSFVRYPIPFLKFKRKGERLWFGKSGQFAHPEQIEFGNNIFINANFHISAHKLVFGDNIIIGPNLLIECDDHKYDIVGKTIFDARKQRDKGFIIFENDIWLGAYVTVLKNTVISEGSIIGANTVITKSTIPYTINVGNPSRPVKIRYPIDALAIHLRIVNSKYSVDELIEKYETANLL